MIIHCFNVKKLRAKS